VEFLAFQAVATRRFLRECSVAIFAAALAALICGISQDAYALTPLPTVTSIPYVHFQANTPLTVPITGANFTGATQVNFGSFGNATSFTVNSDSSIIAIFPPQSSDPYTVSVTVTTPGGTSTPFTFYVGVAAPSSSTNSIKLRAMQVSATPIIANIYGQAITGAIDSAIDAGFSDNASALTPNGGGFTFNIPLGQPAADIARSGGFRTGASSLAIERRGESGGAGPGSLANGRWGGNGAPPGVRLIDMGVMPLPPGSGVPPVGETRFLPNQVVVQFSAGMTPQQIAAFAQRFGLTMVAQQTIAVLGRTVYTFHIGNGQSVREVIRLVEAAGLKAAVQPNYTYGLTQDQIEPNAGLGDRAQYIVKKLQLADAHRISKGDNVLIAVIDSEIDSNQHELADTVTDRFDAGCGATAPDPHGTGMAGAIASHAHLLGVAPDAKIIAICAFGGTGHPEGATINIIKGLDYAIQHGARIVNMSFAGPPDPALSQVLQIAREKGILVIAAAGNDGAKSPPLYPGADLSVMAVTATDENDRLFSGANQGKYIAVAAPGVGILVPAPNAGTQITTGTSVATAIVSGVAALLIAHKPSLKPEEIRAILVTTAKHLGSQGINPQFGAGLVDPLKAVEQRVSENPASEQDSLNFFLASPDGSAKRVDDGFSALGYAGPTKVPPLNTASSVPSRDWLAWIDVRGTDFDRNTFGSDLKGEQVNAIAGLTRRLTPDFLVGVLGGYEHFDYSSQAFNGVLTGDGWTTGAYLGWRFAPNLRFDAAAAWSDILANDVAGTASGNFTGSRWLVSGGVTGTYPWQAFVLEPSARVYELWEHENAYTDSLGTLQGDRNFDTGRASGGVKVSYPFAWSNTIKLAPYAGLYGDYYFSMDNATTVGLTTVPLLQGWSARATGGGAATFRGGAQLSAGGEYGGIGSDTRIWTWIVRGSLPF